MGGRGSGSSSPNGAITTGERPLIYSKVGASFAKLPRRLQDSINENLKMSQGMKNDILTGRKNKTTDEWTTTVDKKKIKIITDVVNGKAAYTIKQGNKNLAKNVSKEQAANRVAKFYLDFLK